MRSIYPLIVCVACMSSLASAQVAGSPGGKQGLKTEQDKKEAERRERWTQAMRRAFAGFTSAVAIDVDLKTNPPFTRFPGKGSESDFVGLVAAFLQREAHPLSTGWALVRTADTTPSALRTYAAAAKWLSQVPDDELQKLCGEGVAFGDLSRPSQVFLAGQCSNPGLQMKMANGDFAAASVRMGFLAQVRGGNGNSVTPAVEPFSRDSDSEEALRDRLEKNYQAPHADASEKRELTGDLDFGQGEILSLSEALGRAGKAFRKDYVCDSRMASTTYYWQGRFTEDTFVEFVRVVQQPFDPTTQAGSAVEARAALARALRYKIAPLLDPSLAPKGLTYDDALNGKQMTAGDLAGMFPSWAGNLSAYGIEPSATVTLVPALSLCLVAPGATADQPGESPIGNRWSVIFRP